MYVNRMNHWVTTGMIFLPCKQTLLQSHAPVAVHPALRDCRPIQIWKVMLFFPQPPYLCAQRRAQQNQCVCMVQENASISISSSHYACLLLEEHRSFFQRWYKSIWAGGWKLTQEAASGKTYGGREIRKISAVGKSPLTFHIHMLTTFRHKDCI